MFPSPQRELSDFIGKLDSKTGDIPKTVKRVLTMFDSNADQSIGLDEFAEMNLKYPHLLWPAFRLQYRVQEMTIGLNQWKGAVKRMKLRKDTEEGRTTAKAGWFSCFGAPQQQSTRQRSRSQSKDSDSGGATPSGRHGDGRKLNTDRIRRRQSGAASKKLSVIRGRNRANHSQSIASSNEMSVTHMSQTQRTHSNAVGHRRTVTTTASTQGSNKTLRRNTTHATVTRGHSRGESDAQGGRSGWTSQSVADGRTDRMHHTRGSAASIVQDAIDEAELSSPSDDEGEYEVGPARVVHRREARTRTGTLTKRKSSTVHPLDTGEKGFVRRTSAAAGGQMRNTSSSPPLSSLVRASTRIGKDSLSLVTPLSPGKVQLTRE